MRSAPARVLVDTNVLVYAHDPRDVRKQDLALALLDALIADERAVLSAQCLSEFFVIVTRRLPDPLTPEQALAQLERFAGACAVLPVTAAVTTEAARGALRHGLAYWDALIWAAAKLDQIPLILTEDAVHGRSIDGVRFEDPFR